MTSASAANEDGDGPSSPWAAAAAFTYAAWHGHRLATLCTDVASDAIISVSAAAEGTVAAASKQLVGTMEAAGDDVRWALRGEAWPHR